LLRTLARRDGLTGIGNRRDFDERLAQAFHAASQRQLPLALIMLDVDFFKGFNDEYGHLGGDACLRQVSAAVALGVRRPGDSVCRYGGEEIAVLLPATGLDGAMRIAERIRADIEHLAIRHSGSGFGVVTVSAGVASLLPAGGDSQPSDLIVAADQALYRAKKSGRNRVACPSAPGAVPATRYPATVA
jgi:diguanylate cyclase (GGDEF)-like protein